MQVDEVVGSHIRRCRESRLNGRKMSQEALGKELEPWLGRPLAKQEVSAAELGKTSLSAAELLAFALVLEQPLMPFFIPSDGTALELGGRLISTPQLEDRSAHEPDLWKAVSAASTNLQADCKEAERLLNAAKVAIRNASKEASALKGLPRRRRHLSLGETQG